MGKVILLAALVLCGCAAPQPQSPPVWPVETPPVKGRPEHVKSPIAQKLAAIKPRAPRAPVAAVTQSVPAPMRTNTFHLEYPINPTGKYWSLMVSTNLRDWQDTTNYLMVDGDALVFASNNVPMTVWRVRLY